MYRFATIQNVTDRQTTPDDTACQRRPYDRPKILGAEMRRARGPNDVSLCRGTNSRGVEAEFALFTDIPIHAIQQGHGDCNVRENGAATKRMK